MIKIPIYAPTLGGRERDYVLECLDSTWISSKGRFISSFERDFARYVGAPLALSTSNGTTALHLAMLALGVGPGDEVIVPTLTYVATANAVAYTGAKPVLVDALRQSWQLDPEDIRRKLSPRTRAIVVVHLYGQAADMEAILSIARGRGLAVVEDCAEAIGTRIGNRHVGTFGDIGTYSFYGNKTITTGEGGMVVTGDPRLQRKVLHYRGQGLADSREYWHDVVGYNYRMTNVCAAIGLAQLEQVHGFLARKKEIARRYAEGLAGSGYEVHSEMAGTTHSHWMCTVLVPESLDRDHVRNALAAAGIETRPVFSPLHTMPMYADPSQRHHTAEEISSRGICLPSWPGLHDSDIAMITDILLGLLATSTESSSSRGRVGCE